MAVFLLIRHGLTDFVDMAISGRMPNVHLSPRGMEQAESLAERLAGAPIKALMSSPLERTRETATPISRRLGIEIRISEMINEVDFGEWTGRRMDELMHSGHWKNYNLFRSGVRIPGGESMPEVQKRIVAQMEILRAEFNDSAVALVSHGDVIRAAVAYYAGIALDLFTRVTIDVASISVISVDDYGARILRVNDTGDFSGWIRHIMDKVA